MNIGSTIYKYRKSKKMTLKELSEKSGVALATLSRMENGKMTGTLESHLGISRALDIALPDLYKELIAPGKNTELRAGRINADVYVRDNKTASETLVSNTANKKMLPVVIKICKGGATQKECAAGGSEKFVYVIDGKVEATIGETKYSLGKGDTIYFESSAPHCFKNISNADCRLISVLSLY